MYKNSLNFLLLCGKIVIFCGKLDIFVENFIKYNYPVENIEVFSTGFPQTTGNRQ
jgi:hypothetical protein